MNIIEFNDLVETKKYAEEQANEIQKQIMSEVLFKFQQALKYADAAGIKVKVRTSCIDNIYESDGRIYMEGVNI